MKLNSFLIGLFGLLAIAAMVACGDDAEKENLAKLEGSWLATAYLLSDCDNEDQNVNRVLDCTQQECIKYTFSVDSAGTRTYVKQETVGGVTQSEAGKFSVGESSVSFCQENDGEETCTKSSLDISKTNLTLTTSLEDSGCTEVIRFEKEEKEE